MRGWIEVGYMLALGVAFMFAVAFAVASRNAAKRADAYRVLLKLAVMMTFALAIISTL
ncbi:hypothetical protein ACGFIR_30150 [Micromonospora sp. NPDC049051]|uniref:hypothetical protein n=1 Tax=Micromonospora sp. NPDC049051 TaxID=3364264 RepID=UPI0037199A2D